MIKKYLRSYLYTFSIIFISYILITLFSYFNIFNTTIINVLKLFTIVISIFIGSFIIGKKSLKKGYLEGLKYSLIFVLLILIINIIFIRYFNIKLIIYYLIIIISSILGSMFGINYKKNN